MEVDQGGRHIDEALFCVRKGKTMQESRLSICGMNTSMLTYLHVNHPNLKE